MNSFEKSGCALQNPEQQWSQGIPKWLSVKLGVWVSWNVSKLDGLFLSWNHIWLDGCSETEKHEQPLSWVKHSHKTYKRLFKIKMSESGSHVSRGRWCVRWWRDGFLMDGDAGSLKDIWKCHFIMHSTILVSSSKYDLLFQTTVISVSSLILRWLLEDAAGQEVQCQNRSEPALTYHEATKCYLTKHSIRFHIWVILLKLIYL